MNVPEGISYLSLLAESLFSDGKIVFYTEEFAKKMYAMLVEYNGLRYTDTQGWVRFIDEYDMITNFCMPEDFIQIPYTKVFMLRESLNHWLSSIAALDNYKYFSLHTGIKVTMSNSLVPYMFQDCDGSTYIVQNAFAGLFEKSHHHRVQVVQSKSQRWAKSTRDTHDSPLPALRDYSVREDRDYR